MSLAVNVLPNSLGFCISLKQTFFNVITTTLINKYDKGAVVQIATVFRPICHVVCQKSSETRLFRHLSKHVFRSQ